MQRTPLQQYVNIIFAATAIVAALLLLACAQQPRYPAPPLSDGEVAIEISSLSLDRPQFFTVRHGDRNIGFFVVRLETGVQSYFDACVTCFAKKRGYSAEDGMVICRACGTSYSVHKLDKGIGGCYPIRIAGRELEGTYRIPMAAITAEAGKF